jgi:TonB family protein
MKSREVQRRSFKISLLLHGGVLILMLVVPWILRACEQRKPNPKLMFVEFTVSLPPPPAPETPEPPKPEPPKPEPTDEIKIPDKAKPPEPPAPKPPPRDIRQTNRVVRTGPPPKDKPPSAEEIARLLKAGARISDTTSIPDSSQLALGLYFNHVYERMYAVWQQPAQLKNLPGLNTVVTITVEPDGRISGRKKIRGSGNDLMDDSVMKAVNAVKALRALPPGHRRAVDIDITFEITD